MVTGDNSNVTLGSRLDRGQATSLVFSALAAVIRGLNADALDERQELYGDLGLDSLAFAQLLIELEVRLGVQLLDEELMTIELVTVADLIDLVERLSASANSTNSTKS
jgi:acyl carrier protein